MNSRFRETVDAAVRGDRPSFDSLFARNLPALRAFLRVRVGAAMAVKESVEDLAQSVCREVLVDMSDGFEYRGEEAFRKWLFLQASRKIVDKHRFYGRDRRDAAREVVTPPDDDRELLDCYATLCTPSRNVAANEEVARIERALEDLPEPQRDAVVMSRVLGLSYAEIGERIGRSGDAVRGLCARGLAVLASRLGPIGNGDAAPPRSGAS